MNKLYREVVVMPGEEHKNFLKLVRHQKQPKSKVVREAIKDKINQVLDKVVNK